MADNRIRLAASEDIPEGQSRGFDPLERGKDVMFVVRHQGVLYGWVNSCPHIPGAPMAWKKDAYLDASGQHVCCHAHGALFEPDTGLCVQGPCRGAHLMPVPGLHEENGALYLTVRAAIDDKTEA
mgnify:CR=1 FL=1